MSDEEERQNRWRHFLPSNYGNASKIFGIKKNTLFEVGIFAVIWFILTIFLKFKVSSKMFYTIRYGGILAIVAINLIIEWVYDNSIYTFTKKFYKYIKTTKKYRLKRRDVEYVKAEKKEENKKED